MKYEKWFENETKAYEAQIQDGRGKYSWHALNEYYGMFNHSYEEKIAILGYGAAEGSELEYVAQYSKRICIVDPTVKLRSHNINGVILEYSEPKENGKLEFEDCTFDLITCFGVLMYIMNPESVLSELLRVLKTGGVLVIREPSTDLHVGESVQRCAMGKYTRGLPPEFYNQFFSGHNVKMKMNHCLFSPWIRMISIMMERPMNKKWVVAFDEILCKLFTWNYTYKGKNFLTKFLRAHCSYVL